MSLWSDFLNNRDRVIHKLPHYFPIYEKHFSPWVNKSFVAFEKGHPAAFDPQKHGKEAGIQGLWS